MNDTELVEKAESDIDGAFNGSELVEVGYSQAVWTLLAVNEDYYLKALHSDVNMHIFSDAHMNALSYPLRVCAKLSPHSGLQSRMIDNHYEAAWKWIDLALEYTQFCSLFPLWHRDKIGLSISGRRLVVQWPADPDHRYEAYNRIVQKEGYAEITLPPMTDSLLSALSAAITANEDSFQVNFNPRLFDQLSAWSAPMTKARHSLPDDWRFNEFSLKEFRAVVEAIQSMLLAWHWARVQLASSGMPGMGYRSSVWIASHDELVARLRRYTGISAPTIKKLLDLLTFGSNGIRNPDAAIQPLIDLRDGSYALSPFLWLNTAAERNLCVLLNQIPSQKRHYANLTNTKEEAIRSKIVKMLTPRGYRIEKGILRGTDLDIAIIDDAEKACLCLELKWFIEPAEIRETIERSEELANGVKQTKIIKGLRETLDDHLMRTVLKIDESYQFLPAVASHNWIGHDNVQDADVPIIKTGHLLSKLEELNSLSALIGWLQRREFLPVEGKDYRVMPMEIACGGWSTIWYGIDVL